MEKSKKIIIAGGTGFLGNVLIDYFKKKSRFNLHLEPFKNKSQR